MKKLIYCIALQALFLASCNVDEEVAPDMSGHQVAGQGKQFGNAFTVSNVEQAVNNLLARKSESGRTQTITLTPTHYYYKFDPGNQQQLIELENVGYDYWDQPLDYDTPETLQPIALEEPSIYQEATLSESQIISQYTIVPRGGLIPIASNSLKLDNLFLFDEDAGDEQDGEDPDIQPVDVPDPWEPQPIAKATCSDGSGTEFICPDMARTAEEPKLDRLYEGTKYLLSLGINLKELYNEMMLLSGNEDEVIDIAAEKYEKGNDNYRRYYPSGRILVQDNSIGQDVPVRFTLVKARRWFKLATTYTTPTGNFSIGKGFRKKATILVKFKNGNATVHGINGKFKVWEYIWPVKKNLGTFSRTGMQNLTYRFDYSADEHSHTARYWTAAVTMNAMAEMHQLCMDNNMTRPPSGLNIWLSSKITSNASAPMLRRIAHTYAPAQAIQMMLGGWGSSIVNVVKQIVPDITYNYVDNSGVTERYEDFFRTMLHELAHAVHYRRAGNQYWVDYIGYIVRNGGYGKRTTSGNGHAAVGEAWAFYLDNTFRRVYYLPFETGNATAQTIRLNSLRELEGQIPDNNVTINRFRTGSRGWIPFGLLHDMTDVGETVAIVNDQVTGYTLTQLHNGLTSGSTTINGYTNTILSQNASRQAVQVNGLRTSYGW